MNTPVWIHTIPQQKGSQLPLCPDTIDLGTGLSQQRSEDGQPPRWAQFLKSKAAESEVSPFHNSWKAELKYRMWSLEKKPFLPKHSNKWKHSGEMGPGPIGRRGFGECMAAYSTPVNLV